ncbi:NAD-dependent succinate-semialdehyde dehydrogenase [Marmoricola pocheonensis]|uniref:NAD-dependent succinate-semialdehyde dehydrogenase n=1 Tax=Nocardioides pocheonensis TaxID=661485 RepID=A0A3N0GHT1_9ACTN|nr:NAD-dependent succinate-semialdehyde dehydrogenase [Nocardioides pocheonensis]
MAGSTGRPVAELHRRFERDSALSQLWIDGESLAAPLDGTFLVEDPSTTEPIGRVADASPAEATRAVDAAAAAFEDWSSTPPRTRAEILRRAFDLMIADADYLAYLIMRENGKSLADARGEVTYAAEFFRWFSEEAVRPEGSYATAPTGGVRAVVTHRPAGVAVLVTPWNFPLAMVTRKVAPALAAGCTVVLKPAAETPLSALAIGQILARAGAPAGAFNVIPTVDAPTLVNTMIDDDRVRKLSFTGSTRVGRLLLRRAADRIVNCSMELGGNAPLIVGPGADVETAVEGAMVAKFRNSGQACTAANRFFVHADVADAFLDQFGGRVAALKVGAPLQSDVEIGPLISERAVRGVAQLVEHAVAQGARISAQAPLGGSLNGYFYPPTVLDGVPIEADILEQEIFAPVAPVVRWHEEDDLVQQVNRSEYGLAAYVFSRDLRWSLGLAERLETGMVGINRGLVSDPSSPFGGVKQSGIGREGAREGLREFQETQSCLIDWT